MRARVHVNLTGIDSVVVAVDTGVAEFDDAVNDIHDAWVLQIPG